jgi:hypothetical protein
MGPDGFGQPKGCRAHLLRLPQAGSYAQAAACVILSVPVGLDLCQPASYRSIPCSRDRTIAQPGHPAG